MESVGGWEATSIVRCRILKIECEPFKSVFPSLSRHDPTQENDSVCVAQRVIGDGNSELQATLHIAWHPLFPTREEKSALNHYKKKKNGEGNGNPLQYSCLEKSMDRGVWRAEVLGIT